MRSVLFKPRAETKVVDAYHWYEERRGGGEQLNSSVAISMLCFINDQRELRGFVERCRQS